jgi:hypothetical protein
VVIWRAGPVVLALWATAQAHLAICAPGADGCATLAAGYALWTTRDAGYALLTITDGEQLDEFAVVMAGDLWLVHPVARPVAKPGDVGIGAWACWIEPVLALGRPTVWAMRQQESWRTHK